MTKDFQQELKAKLKEGIKPSDLKRSRSADDIVKVPLPPQEPDSKYPYTQLVSQAEKINELEQANQAKSETIKLLRESRERLENKEKLLTEQLKEKQKDVENLRQQLEETNTKLSQTTSELDQSLFVRAQSLKQFGQIHAKLQAVKKELKENVDYASTELISQDDQISKLRTSQIQAKLRIQELERDLGMAQRLAEMRKSPLPNSDLTPDYLKLIIYTFLVLSFTFWLSSKIKKNGK